MIYKHLSASVELKETDGKHVILTNLYSKERRKGHARELMQQVVNMADTNGWEIFLIVSQYGHPIGPNNKDLESFYASFGFERIPNTQRRVWMQRFPQIP